jgi:hypothetical protein
MYWLKAIFHLIKPIIFKSNENLDNNYLLETPQIRNREKPIAYLGENISYPINKI